MNSSGTPVADQIKLARAWVAWQPVGADLFAYDSGDTGYWRQDMTTLLFSRRCPPLSHSLMFEAIGGVSLIENIQDIEHAQKQLTPGQALVSKEGILWRWDGLVRKGPTSNEAERIRQRQRLDALEAETLEIKAFAEQKIQKLTTANTNLTNIQSDMQTSQKELQTARNEQDKAKQDADEAQLALKSSTVRSFDVREALELAAADRHSILSNERFQ